MPPPRTRTTASTRPSARDNLDALIGSLAEHRIPTRDGRSLGEADAWNAVIRGMDKSRIWPDLRVALAAARNGDGSDLMAMADAFVQRANDGSSSNLTDANVAVGCVDAPTHRGPVDP